MRLLVCGGRNFGEIPDGCPLGQLKKYSFKAELEVFLLREALGQIISERKATVVITGGARGADKHAKSFALEEGLETEVYKPDWKAHGKAAGPIRNAKMLADGKPDLVVAFPGGRGTADMVSKARAAGVEVIEI
jgi:predicted Rossmann-fold nucleotide-binding protein